MRRRLVEGVAPRAHHERAFRYQAALQPELLLGPELEDVGTQRAFHGVGGKMLISDMPMDA